MAIQQTLHQPLPHVERPISDPPRPQRAARRRRRIGGDYGLMGVALLAGPANVIMELARPGVGHGVRRAASKAAESTATRSSGRAPHSPT